MAPWCHRFDEAHPIRALHRDLTIDILMLKTAPRPCGERDRRHDGD